MELRNLQSESVDAIITDPPYGTTALAWDSVINVNQMWQELKRVIKPRRAIVLFGNQPFTSQLIVSNVKWFKYSWIWHKTKGAGFLNAKNAPIEYHEDIAVFSSGTTANGSANQMAYFPQGLVPVNRVRKNYSTGVIGRRPCRGEEGYTQTVENYPTTILKYANDGDGFHPTQKPVDLMRYLVRTYTSEGETVLDFTMGSGSTGVACALENRRFIGIEVNEKYFHIAERRVREAAVSPVRVTASNVEQAVLF